MTDEPRGAVAGPFDRRNSVALPVTGPYGGAMRTFVKRRDVAAPGSIPDVLDMFRSEVRFYREVAPVIGVRAWVQWPWLRPPGSGDGGLVDRGARRWPVAKCPLRPGDPCTLCQIDVTGPQDCGLVYLVMSDPEQRADLHRFNADAGRRGATDRRLRTIPGRARTPDGDAPLQRTR
jgi:hypothetical protein